MLELPTSAHPTQLEAWASLAIPAADFDMNALYAALEARKHELGLTWTDLVSEIGAPFQNCKPRLIRASNLRDLDNARFGVDAGIVLRILIWLGRSPESFVPGHPGADRPDSQLPAAAAGELPSFDVTRIYAKLDTERERRRLSWLQVAQEIGDPFTANGLQRLHRGRVVRFPAVMRLARWLRCPAASLMIRGEPNVEGGRRNMDRPP